MAKYVIDIRNKKLSHAGSKAPSDAIAFLRDAGYKSLHFSQINTLKYLLFPFNYYSALSKVKEGDEVVFQYPVHSASTFKVVLKLAEEMGRKGVRRVALVHDIDFGRGFGSVPEKEELRRLSLFDLLIVHSEQMADVLAAHGCGVPYSVLGLFDYKVEKPNAIKRTPDSEIVFAGNLTKSAFVKRLPALSGKGLRFSLYGIGGESLPKSENVIYRGIFSPEDLSSIQGSWGLVWDGEQTSCCSGSFGDYLKFNSPHKASLYICAGLPLIVPEGTAVAETVRKEGIGIVADSIDSLNLSSISEERYSDMLKAVGRYSERLRRGANLLSALSSNN